PELIKYFFGKYAAELGATSSSIEPEAVEYLQTQNWPGNVRELANVVRKILLLAQGYTINLDHVRAALSRSSPPAVRDQQTLREYVDKMLADAQAGDMQDIHARVVQAAEKELVSRAIELAHGNQAKAARWLGVSRLTMREKLIQFGVHPGQDGSKAR